MGRLPYSATGIIRNTTSSTGSIVIELDPSMEGTPASALEQFEEGTPVRLLVWSDLATGEPTELEAIAEIQQLDVTVVAHALETEGALHDVRQAFLERLSTVEQ